MIRIENPCTADWQKMTPNTDGKFCSHCEKVVVDFSKMNDAEIKKYFIEFTEQKTCGRFLTSQVNRDLHSNDKQHVNKIWNTINRLPVFRGFVLFFASSLIWLNGCVKKQIIQGEAIPDPNCNNQLMGDTIMTVEPEDTTALLPQNDSLKIPSVGFVTPHDEMIVGKIRMTDTISQRIKKKK